MGCDIHLAAEMLNEDTGLWEPVPPPLEPCWSCGEFGTKPDCWNCKGTGVSDWKGWYGDRNYTIFAVLADVRNGHGFAGTYTHEPITPIDTPRGLPADATYESLQRLSDEHSATWVFLSEVEDYNWDQDMIRGGVISIEEYATCQRTGESPENWCGGISGPDIITVTPMEAEKILLEGGEDLDRIYVNYKWVDPLRRYADDFLAQMTKLRATVGDRACRLIMDFDS
jgi:hypothetical protein